MECGPVGPDLSAGVRRPENQKLQCLRVGEAVQLRKGRNSILHFLVLSAPLEEGLVSTCSGKAGRGTDSNTNPLQRSSPGHHLSPSLALPERSQADA